MLHGMGVRVKLHELPGSSSDLVEIGPGVTINRTMAATATWNGKGDPEELPYDIDIEVELEEGRFNCVDLRCSRRRGGPPVTTELMRKLPVVGLTRMVAHEYVVHREKSSKGTTKISPYNWNAAAAAAEGPTDKTLQAVAVAYKFAYACWWPPTQYVATQFELPRSTAAKWVTMARQAGYLAETRERKAGG